MLPPKPSLAFLSFASQTYLNGLNQRTTEEQSHYSARMLLERATREGGLDALEPLLRDVCAGIELCAGAPRRLRMRLLVAATSMATPSSKTARVTVDGLVRAIRAETASVNDKEFAQLAHALVRGILTAASEALPDPTQPLTPEQTAGLAGTLEFIVIQPLTGILRSPDKPAQARAAQCLEAALACLAGTRDGAPSLLLNGHCPELARRLASALLQAILKSISAASVDKAVSGDVFLPIARSIEFLGSICPPKLLQPSLTMALTVARTTADWKARAHAVDLICVALGACADTTSLLAITAALDTRFPLGPADPRAQGVDEAAVRDALAVLEHGLRGILGLVLDLIGTIEQVLTLCKSDRISQVRASAADALLELAPWLELARAMEDLTRRRALVKQNKRRTGKAAAASFPPAAAAAAAAGKNKDTGGGAAVASPAAETVPPIARRLRDRSAAAAARSASAARKPSPLRREDGAPPPAAGPSAARGRAPLAPKRRPETAPAPRAPSSEPDAVEPAPSELQGWDVEPEDRGPDEDLLRTSASGQGPLIGGGGRFPSVVAPLEPAADTAGEASPRSPSCSSEVPDLVPSQAYEAQRAARERDIDLEATSPGGSARPMWRFGSIGGENAELLRAVQNVDADGEGAAVASPENPVEYWRARAATRPGAPAPPPDALIPVPPSRRGAVEIYVTERQAKAQPVSPVPAATGTPPTAPGGSHVRMVVRERARELAARTASAPRARRKVSRAEETAALLRKAAKLQDKGKGWEIYTIEGDVLRPRDFLVEAEAEKKAPAGPPPRPATPPRAPNAPAPAHESLVYLSPGRPNPRAGAIVEQLSAAASPSAHRPPRPAARAPEVITTTAAAAAPPATPTRALMPSVDRVGPATDTNDSPAPPSASRWFVTSPAPGFDRDAPPGTPPPMPSPLPAPTESLASLSFASAARGDELQRTEEPAAALTPAFATPKPPRERWPLKSPRSGSKPTDDDTAAASAPAASPVRIPTTVASPVGSPVPSAKPPTPPRSAQKGTPAKPDARLSAIGIRSPAPAAVPSPSPSPAALPSASKAAAAAPATPEATQTPPTAAGDLTHRTPASSARRQLRMDGADGAPRTASPAVTALLSRLARLEDELQDLSRTYNVDPSTYTASAAPSHASRGSAQRSLGTPLRDADPATVRSAFGASPVPLIPYSPYAAEPASAPRSGGGAHVRALDLLGAGAGLDDTDGIAEPQPPATTGVRDLIDFAGDEDDFVGAAAVALTPQGMAMIIDDDVDEPSVAKRNWEGEQRGEWSPGPSRGSVGLVRRSVDRWRALNESATETSAAEEEAMSVAALRERFERNLQAERDRYLEQVAEIRVRMSPYGSQAGSASASPYKL